MTPDISPRHVSPVRAPIRLLESGRRAVTEVFVGRDEPVFAGHYPDFPVFPGACLTELVLRSAELTAPPQSRPVELLSIDSLRLLRMVTPDEVIIVELDWSVEETIVHCAATVSTASAKVATMRLTLATAKDLP
jgi:3-hydroxyacyl-[acyl-carrier-protein] dehydratase